MTPGATGRPSRLEPPSPPLSDGRLSLRLLVPADAEAIYQICQDPEIARWTTIPQPYRRAHARTFISQARRAWREGRDPTFAIVEPETDKLIGAIGLRDEGGRRWEVGYWVAPEARGRGVASAALRLVSPWALTELGARRIGLLVYVGNDASARVALRAGYLREGILRRYADQRGELRDAIVHSLLPEDYLLGASRTGVRMLG